MGREEPIFILRSRDLLEKDNSAMYWIFAQSHHGSMTESPNNEIEAFNNQDEKIKLPTDF